MQTDCLTLRAGRRTSSGAPRTDRPVAQSIEQHLRVFEIGGIEALGERIVDPGERLARLVLLAELPIGRGDDDASPPEVGHVDLVGEREREVVVGNAVGIPYNPSGRRQSPPLQLTVAALPRKVEIKSVPLVKQVGA